MHVQVHVVEVVKVVALMRVADVVVVVWMDAREIVLVDAMVVLEHVQLLVKEIVWDIVQVVLVLVKVVELHVLLHVLITVHLLQFFN